MRIEVGVPGALLAAWWPPQAATSQSALFVRRGLCRARYPRTNPSFREVGRRRGAFRGRLALLRLSIAIVYVRCAEGVDH